MHKLNSTLRSFGVTAIALGAVISGTAAAHAATFGGVRAANPSFADARDAAKAKKTTLYVADNANNQISEFHVTKLKSPQPFAVITNGIAGPQGITTDKAGNLYVANMYGDTVTIYAPGATTPKATLSNGINSPTDVRVDAFGNLYVSNSPGFGAQSFIDEFPAGSSAPSAQWFTPAGNQIISGFALLNPSQSGETSIYAAAYTLNGSGFASGALLSCYPGNSTCVSLGQSTFGQTGGVAVAESPGLSKPFDYLVIDQYLPGVDNFVVNGGISESQLVTGGTPEFMALNALKTQLFVSDRFSGNVYEYSYPGGKVLNTFSPHGGHTQIYGVAVSPAGTYF
jgi:hypothetical protein